MSLYGSFGLPTMNELASMALNTPSFQTRVLQAAPSVLTRAQPVAEALGVGRLLNAATRGVSALGNINAAQDNLGTLIGASNVRRLIRNPDGSTTVLQGFKKGGMVKNKKHNYKKKNKK